MGAKVGSLCAFKMRKGVNADPLGTREVPEAAHLSRHWRPSFVKARFAGDGRPP